MKVYHVWKLWHREWASAVGDRDVLSACKKAVEVGTQSKRLAVNAKRMKSTFRELSDLGEVEETFDAQAILVKYSGGGLRGAEGQKATAVLKERKTFIRDLSRTSAIMPDGNSYPVTADTLKRFIEHRVSDAERTFRMDVLNVDLRLMASCHRSPAQREAWDMAVADGEVQRAARRAEEVYKSLRWKTLLGDGVAEERISFPRRGRTFGIRKIFLDAGYGIDGNPYPLSPDSLAWFVESHVEKHGPTFRLDSLQSDINLIAAIHEAEGFGDGWREVLEREEVKRALSKAAEVDDALVRKSKAVGRAAYLERQGDGRRVDVEVYPAGWTGTQTGEADDAGADVPDDSHRDESDDMLIDEVAKSREEPGPSMASTIASSQEGMDVDAIAVDENGGTKLLGGAITEGAGFGGRGQQGSRTNVTVGEESCSASAVEPSEEQLLEAVRHLILGKDLDTLTHRSVHDDVERKFGISLETKKHLVYSLIDRVLAEPAGTDLKARIPSVSKLRQGIRDILAKSRLTQLTTRTVWEALERKFGGDLTKEKIVVNHLIDQALAVHTGVGSVRAAVERDLETRGPSAEELSAAIREILAKSDLDTLTEKAICTAIDQKFEMVDFTGQWTLVKELIDEARAGWIYGGDDDELEDKNEDEDEDEDVVDDVETKVDGSMDTDKPSPEQLSQAIHQILAGADPNVLSNRLLKASLEEKFGVDLKPRKELVHRLIEEALGMQGDVDDANGVGGGLTSSTKPSGEVRSGKPCAVKAGEPSAEQFLDAIREILAVSDLDTTNGAIYAALEEKFGLDLTEKETLLSPLIDQVLREIADAENEGNAVELPGMTRARLVAEGDRDNSFERSGGNVGSGRRVGRGRNHDESGRRNERSVTSSAMVEPIGQCSRWSPDIVDHQQVQNGDRADNNDVGEIHDANGEAFSQQKVAVHVNLSPMPHIDSDGGDVGTSVAVTIKEKTEDRKKVKEANEKLRGVVQKENSCSDEDWVVADIAMKQLESLTIDEIAKETSLGKVLKVFRWNKINDCHRFDLSERPSKMMTELEKHGYVINRRGVIKRQKQEKKVLKSGGVGDDENIEDENNTRAQWGQPAPPKRGGKRRGDSKFVRNMRRQTDLFYKIGVVPAGTNPLPVTPSILARFLEIRILSIRSGSFTTRQLQLQLETLRDLHTSLAPKGAEAWTIAWNLAMEDNIVMGFYQTAMQMVENATDGNSDDEAYDLILDANSTARVLHQYGETDNCADGARARTLAKQQSPAYEGRLQHIREVLVQSGMVAAGSQPFPISPFTLKQFLVHNLTQQGNVAFDWDGFKLDLERMKAYHTWKLWHQEWKRAVTDPDIQSELQKAVDNAGAWIGQVANTKQVAGLLKELANFGKMEETLDAQLTLLRNHKSDKKCSEKRAAVIGNRKAVIREMIYAEGIVPEGGKIYPVSPLTLQRYIEKRVALDGSRFRIDILNLDLHFIGNKHRNPGEEEAWEVAIADEGVKKAARRAEEFYRSLQEELLPGEGDEIESEHLLLSSRSRASKLRGFFRRYGIVPEGDPYPLIPETLAQFILQSKIVLGPTFRLQNLKNDLKLMAGSHHAEGYGDIWEAIIKDEMVKKALRESAEFDTVLLERSALVATAAEMERAAGGKRVVVQNPTIAVDETFLAVSVHLTPSMSKLDGKQQISGGDGPPAVDTRESCDEPSEDELRQTVREVLAGRNPGYVTTRTVRLALEQKFRIDLSAAEKKSMVTRLVDQVFDERTVGGGPAHDQPAVEVELGSVGNGSGAQMAGDGRASEQDMSEKDMEIDRDPSYGADERRGPQSSDNLSTGTPRPTAGEVEMDQDETVEEGEVDGSCRDQDSVAANINDAEGLGNNGTSKKDDGKDGKKRATFFQKAFTAWGVIPGSENPFPITPSVLSRCLEIQIHLIKSGTVSPADVLDRLQSVRQNHNRIHKQRQDGPNWSEAGKMTMEDDVVISQITALRSLEDEVQALRGDYGATEGKGMMLLPCQRMNEDYARVRNTFVKLRLIAEGRNPFPVPPIHLIRYIEDSITLPEFSWTQLKRDLECMRSFHLVNSWHGEWNRAMTHKAVGPAFTKAVEMGVTSGQIVPVADHIQLVLRRLRDVTGDKEAIEAHVMLLNCDAGVENQSGDHRTIIRLRKVYVEDEFRSLGSQYPVTSSTLKRYIEYRVSDEGSYFRFDVLTGDLKIMELSHISETSRDAWDTAIADGGVQRVLAWAEGIDKALKGKKAAAHEKDGTPFPRDRAAALRKLFRISGIVPAGNPYPVNPTSLAQFIKYRIAKSGPVHSHTLLKKDLDIIKVSHSLDGFWQYWKKAIGSAVVVGMLKESAQAEHALMTQRKAVAKIAEMERSLGGRKAVINGGPSSASWVGSATESHPTGSPKARSIEEMLYGKEKGPDKRTEKYYLYTRVELLRTHFCISKKAGDADVFPVSSATLAEWIEDYVKSGGDGFKMGYLERDMEAVGTFHYLKENGWGDQWEEALRSDEFPAAWARAEAADIRIRGQGGIAGAWPPYSLPDEVSELLGPQHKVFLQQQLKKVQPEKRKRYEMMLLENLPKRPNETPNGVEWPVDPSPNMHLPSEGDAVDVQMLEISSNEKGTQHSNGFANKGNTSPNTNTIRTETHLDLHVIEVQSDEEGLGLGAEVVKSELGGDEGVVFLAAKETHPSSNRTSFKIDVAEDMHVVEALSDPEGAEFTTDLVDSDREEDDGTVFAGFCCAIEETSPEDIALEADEASTCPEAVTGTVKWRQASEDRPGSSGHRKDGDRSSGRHDRGSRKEEARHMDQVRVRRKGRSQSRTRNGRDEGRDVERRDRHDDRRRRDSIDPRERHKERSRSPIRGGREVDRDRDGRKRDSVRDDRRDSVGTVRDLARDLIVATSIRDRRDSRASSPIREERGLVMNSYRPRRDSATEDWQRRSRRSERRDRRRSGLDERDRRGRDGSHDRSRERRGRYGSKDGSRRRSRSVKRDERVRSPGGQERREEPRRKSHASRSGDSRKAETRTVERTEVRPDRTGRSEEKSASHVKERRSREQLPAVATDDRSAAKKGDASKPAAANAPAADAEQSLTMATGDRTAAKRSDAPALKTNIAGTVNSGVAEQKITDVTDSSGLPSCDITDQSHQTINSVRRKSRCNEGMDVVAPQPVNPEAPSPSASVTASLSEDRIDMAKQSERDGLISITSPLPTSLPIIEKTVVTTSSAGTSIETTVTTTPSTTNPQKQFVSTTTPSAITFPITAHSSMVILTKPASSTNASTTASSATNPPTVADTTRTPSTNTALAASVSTTNAPTTTSSSPTNTMTTTTLPPSSSIALPLLTIYPLPVTTNPRPILPAPSTPTQTINNRITTAYVKAFSAPSAATAGLGFSPPPRMRWHQASSSGARQKRYLKTPDEVAVLEKAFEEAEYIGDRLGALCEVLGIEGGKIKRWFKSKRKSKKKEIQQGLGGGVDGGMGYEMVGVGGSSGDGGVISESDAIFDRPPEWYLEVEELPVLSVSEFVDIVVPGFLEGGEGGGDEAVGEGGVPAIKLEYDVDVEEGRVGGGGEAAADNGAGRTVGEAVPVGAARDGDEEGGEEEEEVASGVVLPVGMVQGQLGGDAVEADTPAEGCHESAETSTSIRNVETRADAFEMFEPDDSYPPARTIDTSRRVSEIASGSSSRSHTPDRIRLVIKDGAKSIGTAELTPMKRTRSNSSGNSTFTGRKEGKKTKKRKKRRVSSPAGHVVVESESVGFESILTIPFAERPGHETGPGVSHWVAGRDDAESSDEGVPLATLRRKRKSMSTPQRMTSGDGTSPLSGVIDTPASGPLTSPVPPLTTEHTEEETPLRNVKRPRGGVVSPEDESGDEIDRMPLAARSRRRVEVGAGGSSSGVGKVGVATRLFSDDLAPREEQGGSGSSFRDGVEGGSVLVCYREHVGREDESMPVNVRVMGRVEVLILMEDGSVVGRNLATDAVGQVPLGVFVPPEDVVVEGGGGKGKGVERMPMPVVTVRKRWNEEGLNVYQVAENETVIGFQMDFGGGKRKARVDYIEVGDEGSDDDGQEDQSNFDRYFNVGRGGEMADGNPEGREKTALGNVGPSDNEPVLFLSAREMEEVSEPAQERIGNASPSMGERDEFLARVNDYLREQPDHSSEPLPETLPSSSPMGDEGAQYFGGDAAEDVDMAVADEVQAAPVSSLNQQPPTDLKCESIRQPSSQPQNVFQGILSEVLEQHRVPDAEPSHVSSVQQVIAVPTVVKQSHASQNATEEPTSPTTDRISPFLVILWRMLETPQYTRYMHWNESGTAVVVEDFAPLSEKVLPKHFTMMTKTPFVHALQIHGFTVSLSEDKPDKALPRVPSQCTFSHPQFVRARPDLLTRIRPLSCGRHLEMPSGWEKVEFKPVERVPLAVEVSRQMADKGKSSAAGIGTPGSTIHVNGTGTMDDPICLSDDEGDEMEGADQGEGQHPEQEAHGEQGPICMPMVTFGTEPEMDPDGCEWCMHCYECNSCLYAPDYGFGF
ncbi:Heat shock factor protein 2 [Rhizophlyctis rosea]|nr:Heat shock factor protein 2 [Rhizophlyctis rosea]